MSLAGPACVRLLSRRLQLSQHPQDKLSPPSRLRKYVVQKFTHFVEGYESFLERRYPKVFQVYGTFKGGVHGLINDTHTYALVSASVWRGQELHTLSRRELELYLEVPKLLPKIAPLLVISTLPGGFSIFGIAYYFPRHLLTHHFWTEKQKEEFNLFYHAHRLENFPSILSYVSRQVSRQIHSDRETQKFTHVLNKLADSHDVTVKDILELKPHFETAPFHLDCLSNTHVRHLAKVLNLSMRSSRLQQDGLVLLHADRSMRSEGLDAMSDAEIIKACLNRGLNPYGLSRKTQTEFLERWIQISVDLDENSVSLLLHCPVLLAFNSPSNRKLMKSHKYRWRRKKT